VKRFVWLILAAFCTALAQVPAVESPVAEDVSCPCCDVPGACGMPDCSLPPAPASSGFLAEQPVSLAQPAASRSVARSCRLAFNFASSRHVDRSTWQLPIHASAVTELPLFKAHCSFLI